MDGWIIYHNVQQGIGHPKECPLQTQGDLQSTHIKYEEEALWTTQEVECLLGLEEADITQSPLTGVSVKTEDHKDKPQADNLLAPLSDSEATSHSPEDEDRDDTQEPASSNTDCEDIQQLISHQEGLPSQSQVGIFTLEQEDPQSTHFKEEEEEPWITQVRKCLPRPEEADLTKFPLTGVPVKTEDHEDGQEAVKLLAPLSESDDTMSRYPEEEDRNESQEEPLSSDTYYEGDMRTHDNQHSQDKPPRNNKKCLQTCKKMYVCPVCGKGLSYKRNMEVHMRTHNAEKPFRCSVCGKQFSQKVHLVSHMTTHTGEKPFGCSFCGKGFTQKTHMVLHMRTHTGEKPFQCLYCGKRFTQTTHMKSHLRTHTGEKPFSCLVCGYTFSQMGNLNRHLRTHTTDKHFSCSICGEKYTCKTSLTSHMRTHNRGKRFNCLVCGKRFSQKSKMRAHMTIHEEHKASCGSLNDERVSKALCILSKERTQSREKPFNCYICGKSYTVKASLIVHQRTHTEEKAFKL
ncbi:gastrula zinc finger protein XlCGF57.1-like isoform X2 [Nerophis ophidion]|uniref:gastrula zinc finger protein XlCGF57.1-like isoform X2 n=1 Tax=Nerophis ophidion TaxID=159077 RepID=UPI002AE06A6C|nr:gastrula zinc finger protein XlCGF57.1-like isoform X2 [Nerophis ophidion]